MKKIVSSLLALSILALSAPAWAAGSDPANPVSPLRAAVANSGAQLVVAPSQPAAAAAQSIPRTLPRTGSTRIRKQGGGGHAGMVIGLVGTLAGAAGTYYMIKEMRKTTDQAQKQQ